MNKHTPGPWHFRKDGNVNILESEAMGGYDGKYALVSFGDEEYYPWASASDADWQLISASPDLYEVLKRAVLVTEDYQRINNLIGDPGWVQDAKVAIAKAEGHA